MSLEPLTIALGIPLAKKATESVLSWAKGGFLSILDKADSTQPITSQPSLTDRLEQIAQSIRSSLSKHNIGSPFSIEVGDDASGSTRIQVQSTDQKQIEEAMRQHPEWLTQLSELISLVPHAGPLGLRQVTARVTESDSLLTY